MLQSHCWPAALAQLARLAQLATVVALAVVPALGCGSTPPARFYVLESLPVASAPPSGSRQLVVDVGPVILAQGLDRPQMLARLGPNELALDDYARWAEPLDANIGRVLAETIGVLTGSENVGQVPDAETGLDGWQVAVQVLRCEAGSDGHSLLVARWRLYPPGHDEPSLTRRSVLQSPMKTSDAAGLAAALSLTLAELAAEIAAALPAS